MHRLWTLCCLPAALILMAASCSRPQSAPPPLPKVTVAQPQVATVTNWDEYPGHLEAVEMVEIRPRVAGYIQSIHFQDGAEVKAGDLLIVIDPRPFEAELEHARAQRQQAEAHLEWTRNDFKRVEALRGTKAISEEEYDSRSKAVREAEAGLAAAQASEATARLNLDYTQIRAPINGRIGRRLVTPGNFVQLQGNGGNATVLALIVSLEPIYSYFDATEEAYLQYRQNGTASQPLPCELGLVNEAGFPHHGQVDFFDNQVNPRTGTMRLRAVFDNHDRTLLPGLFARLRVPAGPPTQALLIPDIAIGSDQGRKFVYVVNQDNVVESRSVKIDRQHGPLRAITEGVAPTDRVIINGFMTVRAGMKVELETAALGSIAEVGNSGGQESAKAP